ncbi:TetR/AcrR family transcriptional regulator [Geodermatophilus sp. URMC 60]
MDAAGPTGAGGPLRQDAARNRARILAAARRLFAETGRPVTHNEVAHAADVGVGTVYRRFPRREDLLQALFEDQVGEVVGLAEAALAEPDPAAALRGLLERVVELQAADRGLQEYMLGPSGRSRAGAATERIAPVVAELLSRAQERGQVRADVTVLDVALVPVMVAGVVERARGIAPGVWRRVLRLALDGLRPAEEPLPGRPLRPEQFERVMSNVRR